MQQWSNFYPRTSKSCQLGANYDITSPQKTNWQFSEFFEMSSFLSINGSIGWLGSLPVKFVLFHLVTCKRRSVKTSVHYLIVQNFLKALERMTLLITYNRPADNKKFKRSILEFSSGVRTVAEKYGKLGLLVGTLNCEHRYGSIFHLFLKDFNKSRRSIKSIASTKLMLAVRQLAKQSWFGSP